MENNFNIFLIARKTKEFKDLNSILKKEIGHKLNYVRNIGELRKKHKIESVLICDLDDQENMNIIKNLSNENIILGISKNKSYLSLDIEVFILPFKLINLINSIKKILKNKVSDANLTTIANFSYNNRSGKLIDNKNKIINLTEMENKFISFLLSSKKPVSKKEVLKNVWGHQKDLETHTLESLIYRLRQKIEKDIKNPRIVISRGKNYLIKI